MSKKITKNQLKAVLSYAKEQNQKAIALPYCISANDSEPVMVQVDVTISAQEAERIANAVADVVFHEDVYSPTLFEPVFFYHFATSATNLQLPDMSEATNWDEIEEIRTGLNLEAALSSYASEGFMGNYYRLKDDCRALIKYRKECYSHNAGAFNTLLDLVKSLGESLVKASSELDIGQLQDVTQQMQTLLDGGIDPEKVITAYGAYLNHPKFEEEMAPADSTKSASSQVAVDNLEDRVFRLEQAKAKLAMLRPQQSQEGSKKEM